MFIEKLVKTRKSHNVSQIELARRMGIHPSALCRTEAGRVDPSLSFVEAYLEALGCSLEIIENE